MIGRLSCPSHLNRSSQTFPSVGARGGTISASPSCGELPCSTKLLSEPVRSKPKTSFSAVHVKFNVVHSCSSKPAIKIMSFNVLATGIWSPALHLSNSNDGLVT